MNIANVLLIFNLDETQYALDASKGRCVEVLNTFFLFSLIVLLVLLCVWWLMAVLIAMTLMRIVPLHWV